MNVVAFNGSPHKDGNTSILLGQALSELKKGGIDTELVHLKGPLRGCIACFQCHETKNGRCVFEGDIINSCIEKMAAADGVLLGSPHISRISRLSSKLS